MLISKFLKSKKKGISLLEIVISLAIISILIIPIGNLVLGSVRNNKLTQDKQQGKSILQEAVEKIKNLDSIKDGEVIELQNGIKLKISKDGDNFNITKEAGEEYSISGTITKKSTEAKDGINNKNVDGVLYYKNNKISLVTSEKNISSAVNKLEESLLTDGNSAELYVNKDGSVAVNRNNIPTNFSNKNKSILIITDGNDSSKLKLSVKNDSDNKFTIYFYTIGKKSDTSDVDLDSLIGNVEVITGISEEQLNSNTTYELNMSITNKDKDVENINTDIIKNK